MKKRTSTDPIMKKMEEIAIQAIKKAIFEGTHPRVNGWIEVPILLPEFMTNFFDEIRYNRLWKKRLSPILRYTRVQKIEILDGIPVFPSQNIEKIFIKEAKDIGEKRRITKKLDLTV